MMYLVHRLSNSADNCVHPSCIWWGLCCSPSLYLGGLCCSPFLYLMGSVLFTLSVFGGVCVVHPPCIWWGLCCSPTLYLVGSVLFILLVFVFCFACARSVSCSQSCLFLNFPILIAVSANNSQMIML